jgi:hypothetical protein
LLRMTISYIFHYQYNVTSYPSAIHVFNADLMISSPTFWHSVLLSISLHLSCTIDLILLISYSCWFCWFFHTKVSPVLNNILSAPYLELLTNIWSFYH